MVKWRARYDHISLYRSVKFLVIKKLREFKNKLLKTNFWKTNYRTEESIYVTYLMKDLCPQDRTTLKGKR